MKLEKAKELLQQDLDDPGCVDITDLNEAQRLGIEAMKRLFWIRTRGYRNLTELLPGETED